jgi:mono/diheme cytochrome c family protein
MRGAPIAFAAVKIDRDKAKRGEELWKEHCASCHVDPGGDDPDGKGLLALGLKRTGARRSGGSCWSTEELVS